MINDLHGTNKNVIDLSDVSLHFEIARKIPALFINWLIMNAYYFFIY